MFEGMHSQRIQLLLGDTNRFNTPSKSLCLLTVEGCHVAAVCLMRAATSINPTRAVAVPFRKAKINCRRRSAGELMVEELCDGSVH